MRTFINLVEEEETNDTGQAMVRYDDVLRELAVNNSDRIAHLRFPIPDQKITTIDRMRSILDAIDLSLGKKIPVYVHCFGGMGRTGTVVCCWLLRHGLASKENVLSLLTKLRQADVERATWPAPENKIQCQFVMDWPESSSTAPMRSTINRPKPSTKMLERNWFERMFCFTESNRDCVHSELEIDGINLRSKKTDAAWICGKLEIVSLADLRERVRGLNPNRGNAIKVSELVGDAK